LFYGELPHGAVHGISLANQVNIGMLESSFEVDIIEEAVKFKDHEKITIKKFLNFISNNFLIISKSIFSRYNYFYLVYSLSAYGSFKSLIAIINYRLFSRGEVILHIHRGDFFSRFYRSSINRVITRIAFRLSKKIIVLSENQKAEFEKAFNRPFHVLYNTIEAEYPPNLTKRDRANFIFISNYLIDKGIIDLLDVFTKLSQNHHKLTLKTYGEFSDMNLKEAILKYNSSRISINGPIYGKQKFDAIVQADCLILPSWTEGQPVVLLEAISLGTPVIATAVGLIPELLSEDYPFLSLPGDKDSLETKIIQFINYDNLSAISEKLAALYLKVYSREKHAESLFRIFS